MGVCGSCCRQAPELSLELDEPLDNQALIARQGYSHMFKVMLLGSPGVGKTSMIMRFLGSPFVEIYLKTIGVEFSTKTVSLPHDSSARVKLHILDRAGDLKFKEMTRSFYRSPHGVFIVFDVTNKESFDSLTSHLHDAEKEAGIDVVKFLVGNKIDDVFNRAVRKEEALAFATNHGFRYFECSAKDGTSIDDIFLTMAEVCVDKVDR